MQNPPPTAWLPGQILPLTDTSRSTAQCQSQPQCFLCSLETVWSIFSWSSRRRKKWSTVSKLPFPGAKQSSRVLLSPQVHLCFHGGSLDLGQALLPLSNWGWGGSGGGWSHSPFPSLSLTLFGSKEHRTICDIMAQSPQGLLSSLTPQIKHPCPLCCLGQAGEGLCKE